MTSYPHAPGFVAGNRPKIVTSRFEYVDSFTLERYLATGGYAGLRKALGLPAGEVDDEVKNAIEELPEAFRIPLLMSDVEGFSYKEIAEMLDVPIGTVMSRLHRGRKAMQKMLYDYAKERGLVDESLLTQD
ncbi:MAG: sigma factor-like helix-turn-helix DNA-binding protein [Ilumatobacteraceae bacterium]